MELQNFNSLFEIFATFTLAYVLIDELTENPFVSLISKKILRTDKKINDIHSGITNTLSGLKASVNNIDGLNLNNQTVQEGIPRMVSLLGSVETRYEQSFVELKSLIRKNYSTKVFVYLNSYLFLYCLSVLYLGGWYSDKASDKHNELLNNSLMILDMGTILVLVCGWFVDKRKIASQKKPGQNPFNGYYCMGLAFLVTGILSIVCYYAQWNLLPNTSIANNILLQTTIILPVSNFVIYFIKAARRAKSTLPTLVERANSYELNFRGEIKKVEDFLGMCNYVKTEDVSIVDSSRN